MKTPQAFPWRSVDTQLQKVILNHFMLHSITTESLWGWAIVWKRQSTYTVPRISSLWTSLQIAKTLSQLSWFPPSRLPLAAACRQFLIQELTPISCWTRFLTRSITTVTLSLMQSRSSLNQAFKVRNREVLIQEATRNTASWWSRPVRDGQLKGSLDPLLMPNLKSYFCVFYLNIHPLKLAFFISSGQILR